jgi:hypothetical protein
VTDNTGANNIFQKYYTPPANATSSDGTSEVLKLGLGIGLGLGIPILIACCVGVWWVMRRRKNAGAARAGTSSAPEDRQRMGSEGEKKEAPSISSSAVEPQA